MRRSGNTSPTPTTRLPHLVRCRTISNPGDAHSLPEATAKTIRRALSAIEAADYITTVAGHYAGLRHALIGSMTTLREAHAGSCICGG
jgi:hypothetical protein